MHQYITLAGDDFQSMAVAVPSTDLRGMEPQRLVGPSSWCRISYDY